MATDATWDTVSGAEDAVRAVGVRNRVLGLTARVVGAGLCGVVAGIHLHLWLGGYRGIPTIGWLFLADVVGTGMLGAFVLVGPSGLLPWALLSAAVAVAGTLGGLILSLTIGLFGFEESVQAPLVVPTIVVEALSVVVLGILVKLAWPERTPLRCR